LVTDKIRLIAAFFCVYVIWGTNFLAIRYMVETIPPLTAMGVRSLIAGAILYGWARARGAGVPTRGEWRDALLVGAFLFLGAHGALSWGETRVPSGAAALFMATIPVWLVVVNWLSTGDARPRPGVWLGLASGFAGLAVLTGPSAFGGGGAVAGYLVLLTSAPCWAIGSIIARGQPRVRPLTMTTGMQLIPGGLLLILAGALLGEWRGFEIAAVSGRSVVALAYTIILGSVVTLTAYIYLLRVVSPARVGTYAFVNPLIAVVVGWAFAGESVGPRTVMAGALILAGVAAISLTTDD